MGGVSSIFLAAGRGQVVGDYFQILWLREGGRGLWVSVFRFCGCEKGGEGMGGVFSDFAAAGRGGGMGVGVWGLRVSFVMIVVLLLCVRL